MKKIKKVYWGRINRFAYDAGFTICPNKDGTYNLFDIRLGYHTHKNLSQNVVVMVVQQVLNMMANMG